MTMHVELPPILDVRRAGVGPVVAQAAAVLQAGGLVVIPTDTVYGLAAHPGHPAAVARLFALKGREAGKPIPLLIGDTAAAFAFGAEWTPQAASLAANFWPGALTLVLPMRGTPDTEEGFRVPDCAFTRTLLRAVGGILRVTSANASGEADSLTAPAAAAALGPGVDLVVDDGTAPGGRPSTVARLRDNTLTILRESALSATTLRASIAQG